MILCDGHCWKCGRRFPLTQLVVTSVGETWTGFQCRRCYKKDDQ